MTRLGGDTVVDSTSHDDRDCAHHDIDAGSLGCVRLLLMLRARMSGLAAGTVIRVAARDPIAPIDLPAWCRLTGHIWHGPVEGATRPTYAIEVAPDPIRTELDHPWRVAR